MFFSRSQLKWDLNEVRRDQNLPVAEKVTELVLEFFNLLKDQPMKMQFRKVDGSQISHHASMNYYYRPEKLENMCCYEFYSEINFITRTMAQEKK